MQFPAATAIAVVFAGVLHATWNAMAKATTDRTMTFAAFGVVYIAGGAGGVLVTTRPDAGAWPWLALSAVLHTVYTVLLARSYRLGDFNQVYPIARGSAPLIVAAVATLAIGDRMTAAQLVGVATISAGLGVLALAGRRRVAREAVGAAFLTGASIAAYTLSDGLGVRASHHPVGYASWLFLLMGPGVTWWAVSRRGLGDLRRLPPRQWTVGVIGGVIGLVAYGIVLWAQTTGALAVVAALRETGVITGAILGVVLFRERLAVARVLAAITVAAGAALVNLR